MGNEAEQQNEDVKKQEVMIPKWRFDEVGQLYKDAEAKISTLTAQLEEASKAKAQVEQLNNEMAELKAAYENEKLTAKRNAAVESAIGDKAVDVEVVKKLLDFSTITVDADGTLKGLDEQLKALQKDKPFLWHKAPVVAPKSANSDEPQGKSFAVKLAEKKAKQLSVAAKAKNYFN